jgi:hypothetical protein
MTWPLRLFVPSRNSCNNGFFPHWALNQPGSQLLECLKTLSRATISRDTLLGTSILTTLGTFIFTCGLYIGILFGTPICLQMRIWDNIVYCFQFARTWSWATLSAAGFKAFHGQSLASTKTNHWVCLFVCMWLNLLAIYLSDTNNDTKTNEIYWIKKRFPHRN